MPIGVTGPASPVSMTTSMTLAVTPWTFSLQYCAIPRHVALEPLRFGSELLDGRGLGRVDVIDERLPRALHAARVEIHLGKTVDRVDGRRLVCDPGDVIRAAIALLAGAVPLDERAQAPSPSALSHTGWPPRDGARLADLRIVPAADAVDLFHDLAVLLHQPRVQRIPLVEVFEILHRDARIQVVGARLKDVAAVGRRFGRHRRIDRGVEEHRLQPVEQRVERLVLAAAETSRPSPPRACAAAANCSGVHFSTNFRAVRLLYGPVLIQNSFV